MIRTSSRVEERSPEKHIILLDDKRVAQFREKDETEKMILSAIEEDRIHDFDESICKVFFLTLFYREIYFHIVNSITLFQTIFADKCTGLLKDDLPDQRNKACLFRYGYKFIFCG